MKQLDIPELLDTDSGTAEEITNALLDIRDINRRFGGVSTMQSLVERVAKEVGRTSFTVLEVAAGAGYVPQAAGERLKRRGIHLQITLLDRAQSHLPEKTSEDSAFHHAIVGDALALPFPDSSFDLVGCSLFAHHLVADDLLKFVNE
jgi:ubiquinone/menaquinone biosynthesis C-methylase UbiE